MTVPTSVFEPDTRASPPESVSPPRPSPEATTARHRLGGAWIGWGLFVLAVACGAMLLGILDLNRRLVVLEERPRPAFYRVDPVELLRVASRRAAQLKDLEPGSELERIVERDAVRIERALARLDGQNGAPAIVFHASAIVRSDIPDVTEALKDEVLRDGD